MTYSFNRNYEVVELEELPVNADQESIYARQALAEIRGIYSTREQAEEGAQRAKPYWVATGPDSGYWE